jgi:hypothetical protein
VWVSYSKSMGIDMSLGVSAAEFTEHSGAVVRSDFSPAVGS